MTAIDDKYYLLGGGGGFLGNPIAPELMTPNGLGSYRHYENGSIYWMHTHPFAYEVHGDIRAKWESLGWENSFLGFPQTDESTVGGGRGRASTFQGGAIAWTPTIGAQEVHGAIFERWRALGREDGLGFPLTDESTTPDARGRYNHFENGSIYWTPTTWAHEVVGHIKVAWSQAGWERGPLGYPVGGPDQMRPAVSSTDLQDFEHGSIYDWLGNSRTVIRNAAVIALPGTGIGWADLGNLLSDGDRISVAFSGHPPDGNIQLTLNAGPGITWWKAVSLWSATQGDIAEAWTEGGHTTTTISIPPSAVESSSMFLQFKKAKTLFGIHTGMYWLGRIDRLIGNNVTLTWLQDA